MRRRQNLLQLLHRDLPGGMSRSGHLKHQQQKSQFSHSKNPDRASKESEPPRGTPIQTKTFAKGGQFRITKSVIAIASFPEIGKRLPKRISIFF